MKLGVVDVGGGLRGVYAAGQHGRNYPFYSEYPLRKEYMRFHNFRRTRSYLNLDYIYGTPSNSGGENSLDYWVIQRSPAELVMVACDARTGKTACRQVACQYDAETHRQSHSGEGNAGG